MDVSVTHGLPARLGASQHESLLRHAAPCSFYYVHPNNEDKIPCFISGFKVCLLEGSEDRGVVILRPPSQDICLQTTEAASGVSNTKPCFVPIDGMHRGVSTDARGCEAPHLVRVKVFGVVDEYGVVDTAPSRGGFPGAGQEAFLFPHGMRHHSSERGLSPDIAHGLTITGLYGRRTTQLVPLLNREQELRGVPVISSRSAQPSHVAWL